MGPVSAKRIAAEGFGGLTTLELSGNKLLPEGACCLAEALAVSLLQSLGLSSCLIGNTGLRALALALPCTSRLRRLDVSGNGIDEAGVDFIAFALKQQPGLDLQEINLSGNPIGDRGVAALASSLPYSRCAILDLTRCNLGDEAAKYLAKVLPHATVTRLTLTSNSIGQDGVAHLMETVASSDLRELYLGSNVLSTTSATLLRSTIEDLCCPTEAAGIGDSSFLRGAGNLRVLDLKNNSRLGSYLKSLAAEIGRPKGRLQSLNLTNCGLQYAADKLPLLGQAIACSHSLHDLCLASNGLDCNRMSQLSRGLAGCPLQVLNLRSNLIGAEGAAALVQAFGQKGHCLKELVLTNNQLCAAGAAVIASMLAQSKSLVVLNLANNNIGSDGAAAVAESIMYDSQLLELNLG